MQTQAAFRQGRNGKDKTPRVTGVDVARALALIGMICAHLTYLDGVMGEVLHGFPSALFAFVAGISMSFMAARGAGPAHFILRGLILIALQGLLWLIPSDIVIVLATIGLSMIGLAWAPQWDSYRLAGTAVGLTLASALTWQFDVPVLSASPYPLFMWAVLMVAGMLFQRHMLGDTRALAIGAVTGAALMAADIAARWYSPDLPYFFDVDGHTGGLGDVVGCAGASISICSLCCLIARPWQRVLPAMGRMPLTLYCLHVPTSLVLGAWASVLGAAVLATVWLAFFRRGPVEELMRRSVNAGAAQLERILSEKTADLPGCDELDCSAGVRDGELHVRG